MQAELARLRVFADSEPNVDYVASPKQNATSIGSDLHTTFDRLLHFAHTGSKRERISFRLQRDEKEKKQRGAPKGHKAHRRIVPVGRRTIIRVAPKRICPKHKREPLQKLGKKAEKVIVDLSFTKTGCRKMVIKYTGEERYCPRCRRAYEPPAIKNLCGQTFGHAFRAWAVYQRIILRLPYLVINQAMEDMFHETASTASIINFTESFAEYYKRTESMLLQRLRESPFVHVDETRLSIQGVEHYVWVITDGRHVVFRLTETRETTVARQLLAGYKGVLVSDFYAGYDALECRQQKCWVHLIRDLNDDLWKFPFDEELQGFVLEVKNVFLPIIEAIDRHGLKARNLRKFKPCVAKFYTEVIEGRDYSLDVTKKYQKRFVRYRESLFRFLDEDGIPWN